MALSFLLVLAATVILIRPETPVTKVWILSDISAYACANVSFLSLQCLVFFSHDLWPFFCL